MCQQIGREQHDHKHRRQCHQRVELRAASDCVTDRGSAAAGADRETASEAGCDVANSDRPQLSVGVDLVPVAAWRRFWPSRCCPRTRQSLSRPLESPTPPTRLATQTARRVSADRMEQTDHNNPFRFQRQCRHRPAASSTAMSGPGTRGAHRSSANRSASTAPANSMSASEGRPSTRERTHLVNEFVAHHRGTGELAKLACHHHERNTGHIAD